MCVLWDLIMFLMFFQFIKSTEPWNHLSATICPEKMKKAWPSPQKYTVKTSKVSVAMSSLKVTVLYGFIILLDELCPKTEWNIMIITVSAHAYPFVAPRFCSTFSRAKWVMRPEAINFPLSHSVWDHKDSKENHLLSDLCLLVFQASSLLSTVYQGVNWPMHGTVFIAMFCIAFVNMEVHHQKSPFPPFVNRGKAYIFHPFILLYLFSIYQVFSFLHWHWAHCKSCSIITLHHIFIHTDASLTVKIQIHLLFDMSSVW